MIFFVYLFIMAKVIEKYINKINNSDSQQDAYAKLVWDCLMQIGEPFEKLLETAENQNKKVRLIDEFSDEITIDNIEIV